MLNRPAFAGSARLITLDTPGNTVPNVRLCAPVTVSTWPCPTEGVNAHSKVIPITSQPHRVMVFISLPLRYAPAEEGSPSAGASSTRLPTPWLVDHRQGDGNAVGTGRLVRRRLHLRADPHIQLACPAQTGRGARRRREGNAARLRDQQRVNAREAGNGHRIAAGRQRRRQGEG